MYPIHAFGSEEQKQRWLPKMAAGEVIGCFGLTEPDFGSNPAGMITRAVRLPGGGYRINGRKRWITNGNIAQLAIVWAKLDDVIRCFLVPTNTKGFTAQKIEDKFSLRVSVTSELILEDVEVGEDAILPGVKGMKGPLSCLTQARSGIAFGVVGAAMSCYDTALNYAKERVQFSRPIAGYQLVQQKLVHMVTEITKAQPGAGLTGQAQQLFPRARDRAHGAGHPGWQRHHVRVPDRASHAESRDRVHVRGHARHSYVDRRSAHHRAGRVRLKTGCVAA
jgi:glutaryl-CoA dehydrogenase